MDSMFSRPSPFRSRSVITALMLCAFPAGFGQAADFPEDPLAWPTATQTSKPWTRWWWLGSAVDQKNLTRELESFSKVGLGGVEICPIYGAVGAEDRALDYLSPKWMEMLGHVTTEAQRLGLGVDMTTGTGWPFGGPQVTAGISSSGLEVIRKTAKGGETLTLDLTKKPAVCLRAWPASGEPIDLMDKIRDGKFEWVPPAGDWTVIGISSPKQIQKVKRAAPGGAGNVLDPFSASAMSQYLATFDKAFDGFKAPRPRAQFHDSFEYYGAAWTPDFLAAFQKSRGYDFRDQLPAFAGEGDADQVARVRADYRNTLNELHLGFLRSWHDWARSRGEITRNQAHGSPGNLLDHYAVSEIPETEIFRHVDENQIPMLRLAASAAHSNGTKLVSAETFTWLDEHFQVKPEELKEAVDFVFLGGVNHVFFHGIPYSPEDAVWPGWLFYASTHMGPNGGLWRDLEAFTGYIQRCQSILQEGSHTSDVLLYFPIHDVWHNEQEKLPLFTVHNQDAWLWPTPFYRTSMALWKSGITFDYASDRMLESATVKDGKVILGGHAFSSLVLPAVKRMEPATLEKVLELSQQGAKVVIQESWPSEVPGLSNASKRRDELLALTKSAGFKPRVLPEAELVPALAKVAIPEPMAAKGLRFTRRSHADGYHYFIVNRGKESFDGILPLGVPFESAVILDPWGHTGSQSVAPAALGNEKGVAVQLAPGQSTIIRTFSGRKIAANPAAAPSTPTATTLGGPWKIEFVEGGPTLPASATLQQLGSWTTLADPAAANFSGTARYTTRFESPQLPGMSCQLDLGNVANTARVSLNGQPIGISWCPPHRLDLTKSIKPGENLLEVEVSNLAANRIADLDRRKIEWKRFHEINFVNIEYELFDASGWAPLESGLLGPVRILTSKAGVKPAPTAR